MVENLFLEEICDGDLCKAPESFEDGINLTNKEEEEAKTIQKSRFVELSGDDLDDIVNSAEAQAIKNTTKWGVKLFEGKHKTIKN